MSDSPSTEERTRNIGQMFSQLAPHYDRMNRLMTAGRDGRWRKLAVEAAQPRDAVVLDLGAGTGDLSEEFRRQGARRVVALDVSADMLIRANQKYGRDRIDWLQGDALHLPFPDESFDAVASAFVLRNLPDLAGSFKEMARVLRPGRTASRARHYASAGHPLGANAAAGFRAGRDQARRPGFGRSFGLSVPAQFSQWAIPRPTSCRRYWK